MLTGEIPEKLSDFISNELAKQSDMQKIIRIICLQSLIQNGLAPKTYDSLKFEILRVILSLANFL